jgi:serine/threonine-protein kinase PpkA
LTQLAQTRDDFEYLLVGVRRLLIDIACDVRDFNAQTATAWSQRAEDFDLKLISYLKLLEKRKDHVFTASKREDSNPLLDPAMPVEEYKQTIAKHEPELKKLAEKLKDVILRQSQKQSALLVWLAQVFRPGRQKITPDTVEQQINTTKHRCLVDMIRICKRYAKVTVYLEFEDVVEIDESRRHYALPLGSEGLARLPALVRLYEDWSALDIGGVNSTLNFDVLKVSDVPAWSEGGPR